MGSIESFLIYGAITGVVYALLALGFTLIYGVAEVVNMAHSAFYMLGAYVFFSFTRGTLSLQFLSQDFFVVSLLALILAAIVVAIIGGILQRIFIYPIAEDVIAVLVVTVGLAIMLQQAMTIIYGTGFVSLLPFLPGSIMIGGVTVTYSKILALVVSIILFLSLWIFMEKAKAGRAMRATAQDREVAMLMGINTTRLHILTMAISTAFAAIAGIMISTSTSQIADPFMWLLPLVLAFSIVILGGLGSIKGTLLGALIIGFTETGVTTFLPEGDYFKGAAALIIMVAVLLLRPRGLFGKHIEFEE